MTATRQYVPKPSTANNAEVPVIVAGQYQLRDTRFGFGSTLNLDGGNAMSSYGGVTPIDGDAAASTYTDTPIDGGGA